MRNDFIKNLLDLKQLYCRIESVDISAKSVERHSMQKLSFYLNEQEKQKE